MWGRGPARPGRRNLRRLRQAIAAGWVDELAAAAELRALILCHLHAAIRLASDFEKILAIECVVAADQRNIESGRLDGGKTVAALAHSPQEER